MNTAQTDSPHDEMLKRILDKATGKSSLATLMKAGCDQGALLALLVRLARARKKTVLSKLDVVHAAKRLKRASLILAKLSNWGEGRNLGVSEGEDAESWLIDRQNDLARLAKKLGTMQADRRNPARRRRARARLVAYVIAKTGQPHDEQVALLMTVAENEPDILSDTLRKWRKSNADAIEQARVKMLLSPVDVSSQE